MVIRCERCSTMYELDESLLAPTGSQVQCTKCQHVFTAHPPGAAGRTPGGVAAQPRTADEPGEEGSRDEPMDDAAPPDAPGVKDLASPVRSPAGPTEPAAGTGAPGRSGAQRAPRSGTPAVYRPVTSTPMPRNPALRRDSVSMFEARVRSTARLKWLAPTVALAILFAGVGAWLLLSGRGDPEVQRAHAEALALISLDDGASLERASARLTEAVRHAPGLLGPVAADRALALALRASALGAEIEAPDGAARPEERERSVERPAVGEGMEQAGGEDAEARAREEQASALSRNAFEALRAAQADAGDTPEVARALAVHHAARGERERAMAVLRAAGKQGIHDGWLDLADAWLDAQDPDRGARERAATKLTALAGSRPELLRGRYLLARTQASLGRRSDALATLDALLAANPRHEAGKRLRDVLAATPAIERGHAPPPAQSRVEVARPSQAPQAQAPQGQASGELPASQEPATPAPVKVATQRRKRLPQPEEGSVAPLEQLPPVAAPSAAAPHEMPAAATEAPAPPQVEPAPAPDAQPAPPAAPEAPSRPRRRFIAPGDGPEPELLGGG